MTCGSSDSFATLRGGFVRVPEREPMLVRRADVSTNPVKELIMAITPNKDQVKGELKDLGGKIQEEAGKLVGSKKQQAEGLQKQAEGKLQKGVGDLKETVADAVKKA
jgi:uncharacterized protein YjbJ (UPF0337 family)